MKRKFLAILLQYFIFAALAAFFVWLSLKDLDRKSWEQLKGALHRANYWLLVPVLLLLLASHWLRALRWRQLIEPLGYLPSRANCFLGVMIGYFVNLGAPRVGEVVKCTILARYEKVPADKLVGTIVAERAFDVMCLLTVFGVTLLFQFDVIHSFFAVKTGFFKSPGGHINWMKIGVLVIAAILLFFIIKALLNRFGHINIVQKTRGVFINIWHGLTSVRSLKNKPLFFVYTVGIWLLYWCSTYFGFFAIRETSGLSIFDALTVLAMGSVGMIVSPGGIGAYALLVERTVAFYGVPNSPYGEALGWLLWFGQFLSFILFGVVSFILLPRINKKPLIPNASSPDHTS